jgi:oxygen-dependent protoporphyrinogen oxidase
MTPLRRPTIAVVGAGIAGLAAAWELVHGQDGTDPLSPQVVVLESGDRIGGKLASTEFAGRTLDLAADAFLARRPEATGLVDELGLADQLVPIGASGAFLWARGKLRMMPTGLNLGVPTRWWPLARSGILSPGESLVVTRDLLPFHRAEVSIGDRSVGDIVGSRLGRPVVDRLVDPLVGGIHAGGVDALSAAATFPGLLAAAQQPGSLMRRLGGVPTPAPDTSSPVFWSLSGSTSSLALQLGDALAQRGVTIHTGVSVDAIGSKGPNPSDPARWDLLLGGTGAPTGPDGGAHLEADGVVLAVPASETAVLVAPHAPEAAGMLHSVGYASVALITLSLPPEAIRAPLGGTGFLVPRTSTIDGRPALITGCTYLGRKWPHLARPGDELFRLSVGRFGDERHTELTDDELTGSAFAELSRILDIRGGPLESQVTRWVGAFPQYEVGHLIKVARIDEAIAALRGVALAGAAYRGVGIPACIGSGRAAARRVLASLSGDPDRSGGGSGEPGSPR